MSDFRHRAACRDTDPELFFPVGDAGPAQHQIAAAKVVCRRCPVTEECLAWALHARHEDGVWGGLDMAERRDLHRRHRPAGPGHRTRPRVGASSTPPAVGPGGTSTGSVDLTRATP